MNIDPSADVLRQREQRDLGAVLESMLDVLRPIDDKLAERIRERLENVRDALSVTAPECLPRRWEQVQSVLDVGLYVLPNLQWGHKLLWIWRHE